MENYTWIPYYMELANKLLEYRNNRKDLLKIIYSLDTKFVGYLHEQDNTKLRDIDPFTVFGIFNRGISNGNRLLIADFFKTELKIKSALPTNFTAIPVLNNLKSFFFGFKDKREKEDINNLWKLFECAIKYSDSNTDESIFIESYDKVRSQYVIKYNISMGLYWIRPNSYVALDFPSRNYLQIKNISLFNTLPTGSEYLNIIQTLKTKILNKIINESSFPEFCKNATKFNSNISKSDDENYFDDELNTIYDLLLIKKQLILQGAPGTGKTYATSKIAVALCDDEVPDSRDELMIRYNELVREERIAFTTFHQSMDYEEFIEGIKPVKDSNPMIFEPQDGIFKIMCEKAIKPIVQDEKFQIDDKATVWKVSLMGTGDNEIRQDCLDNNRIRIGWDHYGENLKYEELDEGKIVLNAFINKMQIGDIVFSCYSEKVIDAIGIIEGEYEWDETLTDGYKRVRKVNWIVKGIKEDIYELNNKTRMTLSTVYRLNNISINKVLELIKKYNNSQAIEANDKSYVLIIDEINRGNISKIFGELITLLENDKRMGEKNELWATLPYSNEKFSIPSNLYIIGTMNTADRSLGYIDYAVRRRFAFYTLKAEKSVIEKYYEDKEELKSKAITLFDDVQDLIKHNIASEFNVEDLMIGHSYFLVEDEEELNLKLEYEIKPLLHEYAFDGILDKLKKVDGKYKEIENLGKLTNIITNNQDDSENGED